MVANISGKHPESATYRNYEWAPVTWAPKIISIKAAAAVWPHQVRSILMHPLARCASLRIPATVKQGGIDLRAPVPSHDAGDRDQHIILSPEEVNSERDLLLMQTGGIMMETENGNDIGHWYHSSGCYLATTTAERAAALLNDYAACNPAHGEEVRLAAIAALLKRN